MAASSAEVSVTILGLMLPLFAKAAYLPCGFADSPWESKDKTKEYKYISFMVERFKSACDKGTKNLANGWHLKREKDYS
jgi:hypothetical protein